MTNDKLKYAEKIVAICIVGYLTFFCIFCVYSYLRSGATNGNNDNATVQSIENNNRQLGNELDDIGTKLQYGQAAVNRAEERVGDLQESNAVSSERLRESQELIKRSRDIFRNIDKANGLDETSVESKGTTK